MNLIEYLNKLEKSQKLNSSCVRAIDYWSGCLYVKLKGGYMYRYDSVAEEVYYNFLLARSKGRFYLKNIRGQYRSTRIK